MTPLQTVTPLERQAMSRRQMVTPLERVTITYDGQRQQLIPGVTWIHASHEIVNDALSPGLHPWGSSESDR